MPYRRLPKTDAARLKALKTIIDNNEVYIVRNRVVDWKILNKCQPVYDRLLTACQQYKVRMDAQKRKNARYPQLLKNATMYLSHFIQVLLMAVERGEIKPQTLSLYGLPNDATALPDMRQPDQLLEWGDRIIKGERERIKNKGIQIYNPTIGKVLTHLDIFREAYMAQKNKQMLTAKALENIQKLRPEVDEVILELWNQIENHYADQPPEVRFRECSKLGVVYYYRRKEEHIFGEF